MIIACRFAGRGCSDGLNRPGVSASVVATFTPEIVRCPGRVGSADRWAARINGRTVFVAARPGRLTTGVCLGFGGPFRTIA